MPVPSAWGLKYEEVVGLTWLAYNGQGNIGRWRFPNAGSVWNITKVYQVLNFRAVLVEGPSRVLSFSGTDQLMDWSDNIQQGLTGYSPQYIGRAWRRFQRSTGNRRRTFARRRTGFVCRYLSRAENSDRQSCGFEH
jgi:YD repeat-containing protein